MIHTDDDPKAPQAMQAILQRLSVPLLVFSGVLFVLLLTSYLLLLPRFTQFHRADGTAMSPRAIAAYHKKLVADLTTQERERARLVLPATDDVYDALKDRKHAAFSLPDVRAQLLQAASRLGENGDVIAIDALRIDGDRVTADGRVHNVGTRSITVLAAYVEQVEALPFVTDFERPVFGREQAADGTLHSPFTIAFSLATQ